MEFIEASLFTRSLKNYLTEDHYRSLQTALAENPQLGDLIQGTGGFRKVRWSDERRGKGKRGGLRIIYFYFEEDEQIWMLMLYDKDEAADLNKEQKKMLQAAIAVEKTARKAKRAGKSAEKSSRR